MRSIITLLMVISIYLSRIMIINAQSPPMEWHKCYGTDNGEHVHEGMQTSDLGYIGIGQTDEDIDEAYDLLVIKINENGQYEWQQIIGTPEKAEVGMCVHEVNDGYLIGGGLYGSDHQQRYLAKLDFNGEFIWQKFYDGSGSDAIRNIDITTEGEIITTGYKGASRDGFIFISEDSQGFIMKTDRDGEVIWDKEIPAPQGTKVRVDHDNKGFVIVSTIWVEVPDDAEAHQDVLLMKFDHDGEMYWSKLYGGKKGEHCYDFDLTTDGGYICGGHSRSYGINWDFYLLKIGAEGEKEWHKTFGQPRGYDPEWIHDEAYGVRQTPDGGYVIVGGTGDEFPYSESGSPYGSSDIWMVYLVKTDASGNKLWEGVYGSTTDNDAGEYMGLTKDGGFIIFTDADSPSEFEPNNFGFMKIGK